MNRICCFFLLAMLSVTVHAQTVTDFLNSLEHEAQPNRLSQLKASEIEALSHGHCSRSVRAS